MDRRSFFELLEKINMERRDYNLLKDIDDFNDNKNIEDEINRHLLSKINYKECTVLGFDLLGYSKFKIEKQTLVPLVFDLLYQETIANIVDYEGCFFDGYSFTDNYISTGDGCFQIFENPVQALVFNVLFYTNLHTFNAFRFYPKLRVYVGELVFRSCMTCGKVFSYEGNHYGSAIITNARILSRDKLNRFLIDENAYKWFLSKIDGIENITEITLEDLLDILDIYQDWGSSAIFRNNETFKTDASNKYGREYGKFKSCHIQKIGNVLSKNDLVSIYNLELQVYVYIFNPKVSENGRGLVVSIGNSNNSGIVE